jgi:hypothetical protein
MRPAFPTAGVFATVLGAGSARFWDGETISVQGPVSVASYGRDAKYWSGKVVNDR